VVQLADCGPGVHSKNPVRQDLLLFAHLGLFLTGALLYGFLARELLRHPRVLPGRPMRLLVACLTIWYAGCLLDMLGAILIPNSERLGHMATALDLFRGYAWLLSFPLLTHGLWQLLRDEAGRGDGGGGIPGQTARPVWGWLVPGYLTLPLFLPAAWRAWQESALLLVNVGRSVYSLVFLHVALSSLCSAVVVVRVLKLAPFSDDARLAQFLRWLLAGLGIMVALIASGFLLGQGDGLRTAGWGEPLWRLAVESSGLVLGVTFLYFVLRYNLLRLSLSYRTLRHFASLVALIGVMTIAGSAMGAGGTPQFRRALALGLFIALIAAGAYTPLQNAALRRWAWLRRLLGKSISAEELEGLTRQLQSLDRDETALRDLAAREISRWLATRARFLPPSMEAALWTWFSDPDSRAFNRLDAPTGLASMLQRSDLQAAFPLRAGGELAGILVLEISPAAGGYQEGDMETVQLVLRQLAGALEVRRLLAERIAAERRLAERERLSLLGLVAASLAHELKNPLSAMKALAQTVHEELAAAAPGSDQTRDLEVIVEQIDRLHGVAREILDFTRAPETGEGSSGVGLTALARRILYVLGHEAKRRGIAIDAAGVEEVGAAGGTSATWQTVLFNLLLNAAQHAPAGSTVRVRLTREDGGIVFATENAGPPIPRDIASRLFEPFASTGREGGTGLGLALVAERLRELGGTITVTNEPDRIAFRVRVEESL
jgi:signal transduction histidine kinase